MAENIANNFTKSNYSRDLSRLKIRIESSSWRRSRTLASGIRIAIKKNDPAALLGSIAGSTLLLANRFVSAMHITVSNQSSFERVDVDIELMISLTDRLSSICKSLSNRIFSLLSKEMEIKPAGVNIGHVSDLIQRILGDLNR
jgi:hypothetical protein